MSLALYRKYRPSVFADVIGQEHVTVPLSNALESGKTHHAYLFSGPRGCGKTSSARIMARSFNCDKGPTPNPCGTNLVMILWQMVQVLSMSLNSMLQHMV